MTSPATIAHAVCPYCGRHFADFYRPSINLSLGEEWSDERLHDAMTLRCPAGHEIDMDVLLVDRAGRWAYSPFAIDTAEYPDRPY